MSMSVVPFANAEAASRPNEMSITLLGATGSIGTSTIDLVRLHRHRFLVETVTAQGNARGLARLARDLGAKFAVIAEPDCYGELEDALAGTGIEAAAGIEAIVEGAQRPAGLGMGAVNGAARGGGRRPARSASLKVLLRLLCDASHASGSRVWRNRAAGRFRA